MKKRLMHFAVWVRFECPGIETSIFCTYAGQKTMTVICMPLIGQVRDCHTYDGHCFLYGVLSKNTGLYSLLFENKIQSIKPSYYQECFSLESFSSCNILTSLLVKLR